MSTEHRRPAPWLSWLCACLLLPAWACGQTATFEEVAASGSQRLDAAAARALVTGARARYLLPNGDSRIWTNDADGTFIASNAFVETGYQVVRTVRGQWRVRDDGAYCLAFRWPTFVDRFCRYLYPYRGGYYGFLWRPAPGHTSVQFNIFPPSGEPAQQATAAAATEKPAAHEVRPVPAGLPIPSEWVVTVEGEQRTRNMLISAARGQDDGWALDAAYGWTRAARAPASATLMRDGDGHRLYLVTGADSEISIKLAGQGGSAADGGGVRVLTGTFTPLFDSPKAVTLRRLP